MFHILKSETSLKPGVRGSGPIGRFALATMIVLAAAPLAAETLDDPMSWSLRSSFELKAESYKVKVAYADVIGGYESFMPTASYNINRILTSQIDYSPSPTSIVNIGNGLNTIQNREPNAYAFAVSLPLFDGFKRYNDLQAARSGFAAAVQTRADREQTVLLNVANAYLAVLRDRAIIALRHRQIAALQSIQLSVSLKSSVHDATIGDEALADSRVEAATAALEQAQADLEADQIEMRRLADVEVSPSAKAPRAEAFVPTSVSAVVDRVRALNPKILASRLLAESARHSARSAYAAFLPQANLVVTHAELGANSPTYFKTKDTTVLAEIKVPLYTPGEFAGVSKTSAAAQQKFYESLDTERSVVASARTAFTRYRSLVAQVTQAGRRVAQLSRAVDSLRKEQAIGMRTTVDVLNTIDERGEAAVALARLQYERDSAAYSLGAVMNGLGPDKPAPVELAGR